MNWGLTGIVSKEKRKHGEAQRGMERHEIRQVRLASSHHVVPLIQHLLGAAGQKTSAGRYDGGAGATKTKPETHLSKLEIRAVRAHRARPFRSFHPALG